MKEFRSGPYLTFRVGRREFAIEAEFVYGILPEHELAGTEHPEPGWLAGEARLGGVTFAVVDLRRKLRLRHGTSGRTPCIVVVRPNPASGSSEPSLLGFLADSVSEIIYARAHDFRNGKIRIGRPRQILRPSELTATP